MTKAHQIKLYPTLAQETLLRKSCGVARHSYNWALSKWTELYHAGEKPSAYTLIKLQNSIKRTEMPFYMEVSKTAPQYAIHNLEAAYKKMWKDGAGYPKFKKKGKCQDTFVAVENWQQFKQADFKIHIPRIGKIKCAENLRFEGKVNNVTVKRVADMWFANVNVEISQKETPNETPVINENQVMVGVDFGIKSLMVLSDGTIYENPKALKKNMRRLKQKQRRMSKKQKGSKNRRKAQMKVARAHYKVSCIRKNAIHQATAAIVKKYDRIVIEDLNVKGMAKNHCLAGAVSDAAFGEISRQLAYKAQWAGKEVVKADMFFASSKTCSNCGCKKEILKLSERIFKCENCGYVIDRDLNAAINLANYSPTLRRGKVTLVEKGEHAQSKCLLMKQEIASFDIILGVCVVRTQINFQSQNGNLMNMLVVRNHVNRISLFIEGYAVFQRFILFS